MPYRIEFGRSAAKQLADLPDAARGRVAEKIETLAEEPRPTRSRKLSAEEGLHRIRAGNYRIVYKIEDAVLLVLVVRIGDRKDVYRNL